MDESSGQNENVLKIRRGVAILGILLIIVGQFLVYTIPVKGDQLPPLKTYLSLVGLGIFLLSFFIPIKPSRLTRSNRISIPQPVLWILAAVTFSGLTVLSMLLFLKSGQSNYIPVLTTWFTSGLLYIIAFKSGNINFTQVKEWIKSHRLELIIVGAITLVAALLRLDQLGVYPRVLDGDEGLMGQFAQSTTGGDYANPFALWENFGALYLQAINFVFRVFGETPFALRLLPAISGILAVPCLYLFARHIAGKRVAAISSFLLAFSHAHIHFSRIASVGYIHSTWLVPLELYLLLSGLEKKQSWKTAASGVLLAFHFCVYLTSQLIVGLIFVFMVILLIFMRRWLLSVIRQVAAFWAGLVIAILPEMVYAFLQPQAFFNRLTQNGTFQTGWLAQTMANTGDSAAKILAGRVLHAFLSLIYYPARDFYGSPVPMLTLFTTVFFLMGLGITLVRFRSRGMLLLNGYMWAPVIAIGLFSIPPSADSYRVLIVLPPALILAALAIDETFKFLGFGWQRVPKVYAFSIGTLLVGIAAFNLWAYYGDFVGQCRFGGDLVGRFASYMGSYTRTVDPGASVFLLSDDVFFYGSHGSTDFLSGNHMITNVSESIDSWQGVSGDTIIANPVRIPELETWMRAHPGGKIEYVRDCDNLILLAYTLP
jgi:4-amino-4-deoxy-L-arabinose transferase-like glycosyltransferase